MDRPTDRWGVQEPDNPWSSAARGGGQAPPGEPHYEVDPGAGNPWAFRQRSGGSTHVWTQNPDRPWGRGEVTPTTRQRGRESGASASQQPQRSGRQPESVSGYYPPGVYAPFQGYGYPSASQINPYSGAFTLDPWGNSQSGAPAFNWQLPGSGWDLPYLPWNW